VRTFCSSSWVRFVPRFGTITRDAKTQKRTHARIHKKERQQKKIYYRYFEALAYYRQPTSNTNLATIIYSRFFFLSSFLVSIFFFFLSLNNNSPVKHAHNSHFLPLSSPLPLLPFDSRSLDLSLPGYYSTTNSRPRSYHTP